MSLSFTVSHHRRRPGRGRPARGARRRRAASSAPAPTPSTPRSTAASPRSSPRPASRASSARRSRCRPAAGSGPRPRCSSASATARELTVDGVRRAAAAVARRSSKVASVATTLVDAAHRARRSPTPRRRSPRASCSARYQYLEYKGDATPSKLKKVIVLAAGGAPVRAAVERGATVGDAVTWARDLVNTPANEKSPADCSRTARKLLRGKGVTVQVLDVQAAARRSAWVACSASARARSSRRAS